MQRGSVTGWRNFVAAALAATALVSCGDERDVSSPAPAPTKGATWLAVSDIHFDPFAGSGGPLTDKLAATDPSGWAAILAKTGDPPSGYGQDTNYTLLASALASMARTQPAPQVALVAGDFLAHDFESQYDKFAGDKSPAAYQSFVDKTMAFLALELGDALPRTQFVIALGNNDSYCGDYQGTPHSEFLAHAAQAFEPLVSRGGGAPGFAAQFGDLGSYVARMPGGGGSIVALNDVYWSSRYSNACGSPKQHPGAEELQWLAGALKAIDPKRPAWLMLHVPVGIDVYGSLHASEPVPLLDAGYQRRMLSTIGGRSWSAGLFGHLHMSTFRRVSSSPALALLGVPAISPVFSNNPAYLLLSVASGSASIVDYKAYALDLHATRPAWAPEYSFGATYGLPRFDAGTLGTLQGRLRSNPRMKAAYERYYTSGSGIGGIDAANFQDYWCGNVALTSPAFATCSSPVTSGG